LVTQSAKRNICRPAFSSSAARQTLGPPAGLVQVALQRLKEKAKAA
jgi:hypothetical protein